MRSLLSCAQMRMADSAATQEYGIASILLMENAAIGALRVMEKHYQLASLRILVVCGKGNNGGDGYALSRHLQNAGAIVYIYMQQMPLGVDSLQNYHSAVKMGISFAKDLQGNYDLVVDAYLGTGLKGEVTGEAAEVICAINQMRCPIIALDLPSGIDGDSGSHCGCAVMATHSVTFGYMKTGLMQYPGRQYAGEITVCDISIPPQAVHQCTAFLPEHRDINQILPHRQKDANKGSVGKLGIVAGSRGMVGAAVMCARGALRSGAGLVYVAAPSELWQVYASKMTHEVIVPVDGKGGFSLQSAEEICNMLKGCNAYVLGPGLGSDKSVLPLVQKLITSTDIPLIIDADGINALSGNINVIRGRKGVILTPHPGEFARLTGMDIASLQKDRIRIARDFSVSCGAVVVLKGAGTVTACPDGTVYINPTGNPAMAVGGSGDVLAGVIGALLGGGIAPELSAMAGVYLHGLAGDIAAEEIGEIGMLPLDVAEAMTEAIKVIRRE